MSDVWVGVIHPHARGWIDLLRNVMVSLEGPFRYSSNVVTSISFTFMVGGRARLHILYGLPFIIHFRPHPHASSFWFHHIVLHQHKSLVHIAVFPKGFSYRGTLNEMSFLSPSVWCLNQRSTFITPLGWRPKGA